MTHSPIYFALELLRELVPEAEASVRGHLGDNDEELLLYLLTADLRRPAASSETPNK